MKKLGEDKIFNEAIDGYGFVEIVLEPDGTFCTGCLRAHKRPTKMYTNGHEKLCRYQIVNLYNPMD